MTDGGWTVFLNRFDGSQDFYLYWKDYKDGFGNLTGEFWLGNDKIHYLTTQRNYSMRMEVTYKKTGEKKYAMYDRFWVESENSTYRLHVSGYLGQTETDYWKYHNNMRFSTRDAGSGMSCALKYRGAHWNRGCYSINPTGPYKGHGSVAMTLSTCGIGLTHLNQIQLKIQAN